MGSKKYKKVKKRRFKDEVYIYIYIYIYTEREREREREREEERREKRREGHDVMITDVENGHGDRSSKLDEAVCISYCLITLGKGMNPSILSPPVNK